MDFQQFLSLISQQYEKQLPFVIYSFPESQRVLGILQQDKLLHTVQLPVADGFVMAPFDASEKSVFIPKNGSQLVETDMEPIAVKREKVTIEESQSDYLKHTELVNETIRTIWSGRAKKIVIARQKSVNLARFSITELILRLFSAYPPAFRYVWYHPETGMWCGATPETLVEVQTRQFKTMALAGTQPYQEGEISWRKKEIEEQHFVTEAIIDDLNGDVENIQVAPVETIRAGMLLHLKCDITGTMREEQGTLWRIIDKMHPTPAVCGTPQDFARSYIIKNETDPRKFYTGYLGPVSDRETSAAFYVNLRSMKLSDSTATLFVGGGITADSNAEEEWNETKNKMQTMLQVLQPML